MFQCGTCGELLVRSDTYWVCPTGRHGKLIADHLLVERLRAALGTAQVPKRWTAEGIVALQRRVSLWRARADDQARRFEQLQSRLYELIARVAEGAKMPEGSDADVSEED